MKIAFDTRRSLIELNVDKFFNQICEMNNMVDKINIICMQNPFFPNLMILCLLVAF